ncbi:MAG: transglycosylase SLT domain-containing protein [bacterium]
MFFLAGSFFLFSCATTRYTNPAFDAIYVEHYLNAAGEEYEAGNYDQCSKLCDIGLKNLLSVERLSLKSEELGYYDHQADGLCRLRLKANKKNYPVEKGPDFPVVFNSRVGKWIDFYTGNGRKYFAKWLERSGNYIGMFRGILRENNMPEELACVPIIESGSYPFAVSRANAVGLWQFIHPTGKRYGLQKNHWFDERRDPEKSTLAACKMLNNLRNEFGDWYLALAAYNCGPNKVRRILKEQKTENFWDLYLPKETEDYVPKIIATIMIVNDPLVFGFPLVLENKMEFETVEVYGPVDLKKAAKLVGEPQEKLIHLNPELSRQCTPPDVVPYPLRLPKGKAAKFVKKFSELPAEKKYLSKEQIQTREHNMVIYRVRSGDNLSSIAKKYRVSVRKLRSWNRISRADLIYPGQKLKIYR